MISATVFFFVASGLVLAIYVTARMARKNGDKSRVYQRLFLIAVANGQGESQPEKWEEEINSILDKRRWSIDQLFPSQRIPPLRWLVRGAVSRQKEHIQQTNKLAATALLQELRDFESENPKGDVNKILTLSTESGFGLETIQTSVEKLRDLQDQNYLHWAEESLKALEDLKPQDSDQVPVLLKSMAESLKNAEKTLEDLRITPGELSAIVNALLLEEFPAKKVPH